MLLGFGLPRQGLVDCGERIVEAANIFGEIPSGWPVDLRLPPLAIDPNVWRPTPMGSINLRCS